MATGEIVLGVNGAENGVALEVGMQWGGGLGQAAASSKKPG